MNWRRIIVTGTVAGMLAVTGCAGNLPETNQGNRNGQRVADAVNRRPDTYRTSRRATTNRFTRGIGRTARNVGATARNITDGIGDNLAVPNRAVNRGRVGNTFRYGNNNGRAQALDGNMTTGNDFGFQGYDRGYSYNRGYDGSFDRGLIAGGFNETNDNRSMVNNRTVRRDTDITRGTQNNTRNTNTRNARGNTQGNTRSTQNNTQSNTQGTTRNTQNNTQGTTRSTQNNTQSNTQNNTQGTIRNTQSNTQGTTRNAQNNTQGTTRNTQNNTQGITRNTQNNTQNRDMAPNAQAANMQALQPQAIPHTAFPRVAYPAARSARAMQPNRNFTRNIARNGQNYRGQSERYGMNLRSDGSVYNNGYINREGRRAIANNRVNNRVNGMNSRTNNRDNSNYYRTHSRNDNFAVMSGNESVAVSVTDDDNMAGRFERKQKSVTPGEQQNPSPQQNPAATPAPVPAPAKPATAYNDTYYDYDYSQNDVNYYDNNNNNVDDNTNDNNNTDDNTNENANPTDDQNPPARGRGTRATRAARQRAAK